MNEKYNKIAGSLIGGAVGDALGYQIEFKRNIKDREVTKFNGLGKISDDTQMTLFTANSLIWRETRLNLRGIAMHPKNAIYLGYLDWLATQNACESKTPISWIRSIHELNECRAPGNTCLSALSSGKMGEVSNPINDSKGCGTVMRIAPIGLYIEDAKVAGKIAIDASAITHGHPLALIPSYVMACMINYILNNNMSIMDALNKAVDDLKSYNKFNKNDLDYFINLVNKAILLSQKNINDIDAINELGEGWVAEEAFAIAIYSCLKYQNNFTDAIICAVNHDGDSDSTGAIAGNIIGTSLGLNSIPEYYLNNLELKDTILEIAYDLSIPIPVSEYSNNKDENWIKKYVYCQK